MLRWMTAGESHGPALVAVLDGLPAGVALTSSDLASALARRRLGHGRGARMSFEADELEIIGGLRHGMTMGSPLAVRIGNSEWPKWQAVMSADPVPEEALHQSAGRGDEREVARNRPLTRPRPGHADLAGMQKYGFTDARPVLERASARETAARVALGEAARQLLTQVLGAHVYSHVVALGGVEVPPATPTPEVARLQVREAIDASPVRCADPEASEAMVARIDAAKRAGDTLGGVVEVVVTGLVPGLGSHTQWDRRLDARLAAAVMSIQAIKAVEIGDGLAGAARPGSQAHDEMAWDNDTPGRISRRTARAGGVEGGMSTGEVLRVRAAMKPISTVPRALATVDVASGEAATALHQRSDVCAVPAAGVVAEAMVALVLAEALLEKFGGDHVRDVRAAVDHYRADLAGGRTGHPVVLPEEPL